MGLEKEQLRKICKLGSGEATCSFLSFSSEDGFSCLKKTGLEEIIRQKRDSGQMNAKGDNCSGPPNFDTRGVG